MDYTWITPLKLARYVVEDYVKVCSPDMKMRYSGLFLFGDRLYIDIMTRPSKIRLLMWRCNGLHGSLWIWRLVVMF